MRCLQAGGVKNDSWVLAWAPEGWSCYQLRLRSLVGMGFLGGGVGWGEVGVRSCFGKAELHISGDHPNFDIRKAIGNTRVDSGKEGWARAVRLMAIVGT